jgi:hypothetical protein
MAAPGSLTTATGNSCRELCPDAIATFKPPDADDHV